MPSFEPFSVRRMVTTVLGPVAPEMLGMTDGHNHLWIDAVPGAEPGSPVLNDRSAALAELADYHRSGGSAMLDCQPGGCGRNGIMLAELSRASGVAVVACTGFHRKNYYAPDYWLWQASVEQIAQHIIDELDTGLEETRVLAEPVRAGFIKIAIETILKNTPQAALEGAALAAAKTGAVLEIHTEKGSAAENILDYFINMDVRPGQLILCHMDKRPDLGLHLELARAGVALEYDTFFRPKYEPEVNLWPMIEKMAASGLDDALILATDLAEARLWKHPCDGPGLAALFNEIYPRLQALGLPDQTIKKLLGKNVIGRLARAA